MPTACYYNLLGAGKLVLQREELPASRDDQLFCETLSTAISPGTELAAYNGLAPLRPTENIYPRLLGYMNVARVVDAGKELAEQYPKGTVVYTHQSHRSHFLISRRDVLSVLPSDLNPDLATIAYLYRLGWNGWRRTQAREGDKVGVVGLGAIGLASLQLAKYLGFVPVGFSNHDAARYVADRCGCSAMSKRRATEMYLDKPAASDLMNAVLLTSNAWDDWTLSMAMCRFNAAVGVLGFPGRGEPIPNINPLDSKYFYDKQLTVAAAGFAPGSVGIGQEEPEQLKTDIATILDAMKSNDLEPSLLLASVEPAKELEQIYEEMNANRRGAGTVVLDWSGFD